MSLYNSIAGIALKNGTCLVAKRLPPGEMSHKWEFPGGKVEEGESDHDALIREFEEEFSVRIDVGAEIGKTFFNHNGCRYELRAYEVFLETKDLVLRVHSHTEWLTLDAIEKLDLADSDRSLVPYIRAFIDKNDLSRTHK